MHPQHLTQEARERPPPHSLHGSLAHLLGLVANDGSKSLTAGRPGAAVPSACLMGSQIQGSLKGLQWVPSCPAPGGPPTWDIKVSHAEDKPNPMETPQTLMNWSRTQKRTPGLSRVGGGVKKGNPGGHPVSGGATQQQP